jgi:predicted transcriptional regulator
MQAKRNADVAPAHGLSEEHIDCEVLHLMLAEPGWPWTLDEIGRTLQDHGNAVDAVRRLNEVGLVHRFGDFVFPTRTARRACELEIGTA